ncbi:MAG: UDP-2,3-diacylglucosamine diphosphatase LpxI [bacterium]
MNQKLSASPMPESLALIAGKGVYPLLLAQSAKQQGVKRVAAIAFKHETESAIGRCADEVKWLRIGQLQALLDAVKETGAKYAVMAGQLTPTALFHVRLDALAISELGRLKARNAETIFGAVADLLARNGTELLPASQFMESHMPAAGILSKRTPTAIEESDIQLGFRAAKATSGMDIGQTVVVKNGTILAVEAFEGTNAAIRRAYDLNGAGTVIVKVAKQGHDMRFDIPVIGMDTMKLLRKVRAAVLAVEANRTIILEREKVVEEANRLNISLVALEERR